MNRIISEEEVKLNLERGWADIEGYPGYRITSNGEVLSSIAKSNGKFGRRYLEEWQARKLETHRKGYKKIGLHNLEGKQVRFQVHRLVAIHFLINTERKEQVNHKNGNTGDNRASNLEWMTCSENHLHSYRELGRETVKGSKQGSSKLTEIQVYEIKRRISNKEVHHVIAKDYGVHQVTISTIGNGRLWKHVEYP